MQRTTRLKVAIVTGLIAAPLALMFAPDADADTYTTAENRYLSDLQRDGVPVTASLAPKEVKLGHDIAGLYAQGVDESSIETVLARSTPGSAINVFIHPIVVDAVQDLSGSESLVSYSQRGRHK